jgi:hypothetical protein
MPTGRRQVGGTGVCRKGMGLPAAGREWGIGSVVVRKLCVKTTRYAYGQKPYSLPALSADRQAAGRPIPCLRQAGLLPIPFVRKHPVWGVYKAGGHCTQIFFH